LERSWCIYFTINKFIEYIFGWRGIGNEMVEALSKYDLPVVMGAVLVIASVFVIVNLLVDIIYGLIDPRIRVK
jgi:peptide/nickel transport system permease protein